MITDIKKGILKILLIALAAAGMTGVSSCNDTESYSKLLDKENKAVNDFLATQRVKLEIPADSISFETGEDAPFYKMDEDGNVYMQVISKGDTEKIETGDVVYFRFSRTDLKSRFYGGTPVAEGNSDNLLTGTSSYGNTKFIFGNTYLSSTTQWGEGVQLPMKFFGYNCEVNLVVKSYLGFATDMANCVPYLMNVRYFKAEY